MRLNRSPSAISRELKRNVWKACMMEYNAVAANNSYKIRMSQKAKRWKSSIWKLETQQYIKERLKDGWAPEVIAGRMKKENNPFYVSHETIYRYIYRTGKELTKYLRWRKRKQYTKRGKRIRIPNYVSIKERNPNVKERKELGHYEVDSVISGLNGKSALNVLLEMKSRYVMIAKLTDRKAEATKSA